MDEVGKIEISIEEDKVVFSTNLSIPDMNFWLDHVKNLLITGQAEPSEQ